MLFLVLGIGYSLSTPLWNPPDEELHFAYCQFVARNQSLPDPQPVNEGDYVSQAFHPPLYYLLGAPLCKNHEKPIQEVVEVNDGPGYCLIQHPKNETTQKTSAHLLRLMTLLLSTTTIYVIYRMMLMIFPGAEMLALSAALFAGMNPQFMHVSSSVSNEPLAATLSTLYLWALLQYERYKGPARILVLMGILLGGCLLSKASTLFWIPVTASIVFWQQWRNIRGLFVDLTIIFGPAALLAGWWYAKNWVTLSNLQTSQPWFIRRTPLSLPYLQQVLYNSFTSFFGYFGSLQIPISTGYLLLYGAILLLGTVGLLRLFIKGGLQPFQHRSIVILLISLAGGMGMFMLLNYKFYAFLGKYLFVVLAPITISSLVGLWGILPIKARNPFFIGISIVLIAINADTLFRIVRPAYADPAIEVCADQPIFCCPSPPIHEQSVVEQTFVSSMNNLCAIRIMFSSAVKPQKGTVTFSIRESKGSDKVWCSIHLSHKQIEDCTRYVFVFPPINHSMGKEYTLCLTSTAPSTEQGVALWYEKNDCYPNGHMAVNGQSLNGDLCFTAYCSIQKEPATAWQGKKQTVIRQGQYVNARELQLYYERSKAFREKTITHEKILRITKAVNHRKSAIEHR